MTESQRADSDFFADAHAHFVSTLGLELPPELSDSAAEGSLQIDPYLQADGRPWPNMAALLTMADILMGRLAAQHTAPRISVTADLGVRLFRAAVDERIVFRVRMLKMGQTMSVGAADLVSGRTNELIGTSVGTFLASPRPVDQLPEGLTMDRRAVRSSAPTLAEHVGVSLPSPGVAELPELRPEHGNATQSLQGGLVALLSEAATYGAMSGIAHVVDTLTVHYLAAGRVGPFRATAEPLDQGAERAAFRVELLDLGRDRVIALAETTARPLGE